MTDQERQRHLRVALAAAIADERQAAERASAIINELCKTCDAQTRSTVIRQAFGDAHR